MIILNVVVSTIGAKNSPKNTALSLTKHLQLTVKSNRNNLLSLHYKLALTIGVHHFGS